MSIIRSLAFVLLLMPLALGVSAEEPLHWDVVNQIRDEGFHRSQVLDTARHLTDVIGPRLSGSPASKEAQEWTRDQLKEWGLDAAQLDAFEFGEGWSFDHASVRLIGPRKAPLLGLPRAWTPGTDGAVRGQVQLITLDDEDDLEKHRGQLEGAILLMDDDHSPNAELQNQPFRRYEDHELTSHQHFDLPSGHGAPWRQRARKRFHFSEIRNTFLAEEGVVAVLDGSSRGHGIVRTGGGGSYGIAGRHRGVPHLTLTQEHYNLVKRFLKHDHEVELEVDVQARFHTEDPNTYNTLAEIPGTDLAHEVVLLGAHLDSWHLATGATDNAGPSAVMMEAVRILKTLDLPMRRTVRIALWSGEEQGLLGARHYVEQRLATRPESEDEEQLALPSRLRNPTWPLQLLEGHDDFSVYFNLDNGAGKIRGVWAQENAAVAPLFRRWLEPFHDLGASTVSTNTTGGTDHLAFQSVGLPGYQFIQDPMDYRARTHHTQLDTFDHLVEDDLKQAAVIVASFAYHAAMRDEKMPRKPLPQEPPSKK